MKATFNQLAAAGLALADLISMMVVYLHPMNGVNATAIISALTGAFGMIIMFLVKASSDASHTETNTQMIDAIQKSVPSDTQNSLIQALKDSAPVQIKN